MLKNNFLGSILVGLLAIFLIFAATQFVGIGSNIKEISKPEDLNESLPKVKTSSNTDQQLNITAESIEKINTQPLFSLNRQPYPDKPPEAIETIEVVSEIEDLKAKVTSVVITPEKKYAMIHDDISNQRSFYQEGMPLDGSQGGWSVFEIQQRKVIFKSEDDRTHELELEVYASKGSPRKSRSANKNKQSKEADKNKSSKRTAEEIRKKIAERRAQMRSEALKQKQ